MKLRETWGTRTGFLLAAVASAVGLGNIWRFPYIAGEYGGGAFLLVYLVCIFIIGLPTMIAEFSIGKKGHLTLLSHFQKQHLLNRGLLVVGWVLLLHF